MIEPTYTPIEAINEFYKLKNKYETKHYEKYVQPIVTSNISKREKRVAYSKLPKHKCVNCERNVGTIWDIKVFEDDRMKYYKAKCGDLENPCPLDIHINYSFSEPIYDSIKQDMSSIEKTKLDIIKTKNYALFFNKNVQDDFNELLELLKLDTENVGYLIETNIIRNHNTENVDKEVFKKAYEYATRDPHNFLLIDTTVGAGFKKLRHNFKNFIQTK